MRRDISMRKSTLLLAFYIMSVIFILAAMMHSHYISGARESSALEQRREIVASLGMTDLCLFTETPYTRNPALADISTPFQDHPLSLEHYPSGSMIAPPEGLLKQ